MTNTSKQYKTRQETELYISKVKVEINSLVYSGRYQEAFKLLATAGNVLEWKDYRELLQYLDRKMS